MKRNKARYMLVVIASLITASSIGMHNGAVDEFDKCIAELQYPEMPVLVELVLAEVGVIEAIVAAKCYIALHHQDPQEGLASTYSIVTFTDAQLDAVHKVSEALHGKGDDELSRMLHVIAGQAKRDKPKYEAIAWIHDFICNCIERKLVEIENKYRETMTYAHGLVSMVRRQSTLNDKICSLEEIIRTLQTSQSQESPSPELEELNSAFKQILVIMQLQEPIYDWALNLRDAKVHQVQKVSEDILRTIMKTDDASNLGAQKERCLKEISHIIHSLHDNICTEEDNADFRKKLKDIAYSLFPDNINEAVGNVQARRERDSPYMRYA